MDPLALATRLTTIERRRAGSDPERRAALLLAGELRAVSRRRRRTTRVETLWIRPHRGPVHALFAALAVAGSVVSVDHPTVGLALAGAALLLLAGDLSGRLTLPRRLTFARATQNVVARDPREARVRLVVTAAVDAPTPSLVGRGAPARLEARTRRALRGHLPGPYGVFVLALLALVACTAARQLGAESSLLGALQLVPTIVALFAVGVALDQAAAQAPAQGAGADASAAAVAVALVAALDAAPPQELAVDCVLAGAAGAHALGFRGWLREERRAGRRAEEIAVLHVAACGAGRPVFWEREGLVLPLRFHPRLVAHAREAGLAVHQSRGTSGARAARARRWPAVAVGCVDAAGTAPRRGAEDDTAEHLDPAAMTATLDACLALVRALDAELAAAPQPSGERAPRRGRRRAARDGAAAAAGSTSAAAGGPTTEARPRRSALPAAGARPRRSPDPAAATGSRRSASPAGGARPRRSPSSDAEPVEQPAQDAWRERPPTAPPPQAPPPPPGSARAARRAAAERAAEADVADEAIPRA